MLMVMWMQKNLRINYFLELLRQDWEHLKAYPLRFVLNLAWFAFGFIPLFFVWYFVATNTGAFPYSLKEILLYFAFVWGLAYSVNGVRKHISSINSGEIVTKIVKPISLTENHLYIFFSSIFTIKASNIIVVIILGLIFLGLHSLLGILFFILGIIIACLVYEIILMLMFWFGKSWGLKYMLDMFILVSAGTAVPLDLFPTSVQMLLSYMPFKLMFFYPAKIFLGQLSISWVLILEYLVWAIILYFVCRVLEYFGLRKYEQLGG